ncbi:MAG: DUF3990 domain-containing protein [Roseburia sp.]|nr:DUF3990 domain-containing protein [Anaeroplasma bactoclasticum]MCM1196627.1 DUF3990 domain-containing protein [Roseburia sp.]MCM1557408.1 DUF3990 domain-containing protein [Anaeroplasma bactoclasticum]
MKVGNEIKVIRELLKLTQTELANELNVAYEVVNRWENEKTEIEGYNLENLYNFAYSKKIFINKMYEEILSQEYNSLNSKLLFHGPKKNIIFPIDLNHSKLNNDFGVGFYLGETFEQATTYISNIDTKIVYAFQLNINTLTTYQFHVNREWMLAIAYYRGWINEYKDHSIIQNILNNVKNIDVIIAPIADNRMFDLITEFVKGEITDLQCEHALAATNLGSQFVLKSKKALNNLSFIKECYVSKLEKEEYLRRRMDLSSLGSSKVKLARIEYRGKGQYIDELLK